MYNIKEYIEKAVKLLDEKYTLPDSGLLAGGSLSNTIWKLIGYSKKAIINDIDIFNFSEDEKSISEYYEYRLKVDNTSEYSNLMLYTEGDNYIAFNNETKSGKFNHIILDSNKPFSNDNLFDLLYSFDINSCQVGYDLKNKIAYYTPEFEEFLNTKQLKVVSILSPSNTICRLFKKEKDLESSILQDSEFLILKYSYSAIGKRKIILGTKYVDIFKENYGRLSNFFKLETKNNNFYLIPKDWIINESTFGLHHNENEWYSEKKNRFEYFLKHNNRYIKKEDLIYFCRNILNCKNKRKIWIELPQYFKNLDYIDGIKDLDKCINVISLHCKDIRKIIGEPKMMLRDFNNGRKRIFEDMNLLEQIKIKNILKRKIYEDVKNDYLLDYIEEPINYENEEDVDFLFQTMKIKYRKKLHDRTSKLNPTKIPF
jgi:hypothetical protein